MSITIRLLLCLCAGCFVATASAKVQWAPLERDTIFTIEGVSYSSKAVNTLVGAVQSQNTSVTTGSMIEGIIENALLYRSLTGANPIPGESKKHADENDHDDHAGHSHNLGLASGVQKEYAQLLGRVLAYNPDKALQANLLNNKTYDEQRLRSLLSISSDTVKAKKGMISETIGSEQAETLEDFAVAWFKIADDVQSVSLWDVYSVSNVHDRTAIRRADKTAIAKVSREIIATKLHEQAIAAKYQWLRADFSDLEKMVLHKQFKQAYLKESGIVQDLHHDSALLNGFKVKVTNAEVDAYYSEHQEDFVQVGSVIARHITVRTQKEADQVYEKINDGMSFDAAVKAYSIAEDKHNTIPGELGFINKNDKSLTFVKKLALIQPVGKASTPYRMLDGKTYELLWIDEKKPQQIPLSDKSVRNEIETILAREKSMAHYESLRKQLVSEANIVLNRYMVPEAVYGIEK